MNGYLFVGIISLAVWVVCFWLRPDMRKEMLIVSICVGFLGLILEAFIWTTDWWVPPTITGTLVGIEDFMHGFGIAGVAAVLYRVAFSKRSVKKLPLRNKETALLIALSIVIPSILFFGLGIHSFPSTLAALLTPTVLVWVMRKDLLVPSILNGVLLSICSIPGYLLTDLVDPGYLQRWWLHENLSGILFLGIPVEDLLFYFACGAFLAILWLFWKGEVLEDRNAKVSQS